MTERGISIEMLIEMFELDADTGVIRWKHRPEHHFRTTAARTASHSANRFNSQLAGKVAFTSRHQRGYLRAEIGNKLFQAHRVAFALFYGHWPAGVIDHINGDPSDNRICNLRSVEQAENMKNQALRVNNSSGRVGVRAHKVTGKWHAAIKVNGKNKHLGVFSSHAEASAARSAAESKYGYHQNHGRKTS